MEPIRTVEDSLAFFETLGMQKKIHAPKTIYSYNSLPQKGYAQVWGDIDRFYYTCLDYHTLKEVVQPYQMDEPYVEFGIIEEFENFTTCSKEGEPTQSPPDRLSFTVVRPTGAKGCCYFRRNSHCVGRSFILRHKTCVEQIFPTIHRLFGKDIDEYSILQMAGNACLTSCGEILAGLKNCTYEGNALRLYLNGKAFELLAILTHAIETLDKHAVPQYSPYERQAVWDVEKILQNSILNPPSIRKLALEVAINPNKLQELFKYYNGVTVMEYLRSYRMEQALLLLASDMLLSDIAKQVGYQSAARFSEAFVKAYGISPGKYRKLYITQLDSNAHIS